MVEIFPNALLHRAFGNHIRLRHRTIWSHARRSSELGDASCLLELRFDPAVGGHQPFSQRDAAQYVGKLGFLGR